MKTEFTDKGWREITTKNINVERFGSKPLMLIGQWVDFNNRYPRIGRKRNICNCCRQKWTRLKGSVNIVFTDKGNKAVCDDCFLKLREIFDANE